MHDTNAAWPTEEPDERDVRRREDTITIIRGVTFTVGLALAIWGAVGYASWRVASALASALS